MNIVLMGYMGCGKSSIGSGLAKRLDVEYIDLDEYIEVKEKKSIKQIFEEQGEIYFRKTETKYLDELLKTSMNKVLSLGGGTPCFGNNIDLITSTSSVHSIYLNTSIDELVNRLFKEKDKRPLIAHITSEIELKDFIRKHVFERSFYYNQAAHIVTTDAKSVVTIIEEIDTLLF